MKRTLVKPMAVLACAVGLLASGSMLRAIEIDGVIDIDNLFGTVVPGSPSSPGDETARLNTLIEAYNNNSSPRVLASSPEPGHTYTLEWDGDDLGTLNPVTFASPHLTGTVDLGAGGYDWLMAKWGDNAAYYYIAGEVGIVDLVNDLFMNTSKGEYPQPLGLSHYVLFNEHRVPDGGSTLALLGVGLLCISACTRNRRQA